MARIWRAKDQGVKTGNDHGVNTDKELKLKTGNEERRCVETPKYVGVYADDSLLNIVYQVHEIIGDVYVLEAISYFDMIYFVSCGYEPSDKPVLEQIRELRLSEIENPRLFYSWRGIASEFVRAENERDRRERREERERRRRLEDEELEPINDVES